MVVGCVALADAVMMQMSPGTMFARPPVETAQSLNPDAAVLAVEVGNSLKAEQENSILGLPLLTLNLAMEDRTNFSRRAADIVVRPRTEGFPFLEFHMRVDAEVQEGRRAFDERQEALEALLYGPGAWGRARPPGRDPQA